VEILIRFHVDDASTTGELSELKDRIFEHMRQLPGKPIPAVMMLEMEPRYLVIEDRHGGKSRPEA